MGARQFGARVTRVEDPALLTGRARFVDDVEAARHCSQRCFVRSPHAHARIRRDRYDARRARCPASMRCSPPTTCRADWRPSRCRCRCPMPAITALRTQHALARDEVCYVGEAVALVVADSRYIAEDAAAAGRGRLRGAAGGERLPRRAQARRADRPTAISPATSPPSFPWPMATSTRAFATAAHVFEEEILQHRGGRMSARRPRRAGEPRAGDRACSPCGRRPRRRTSAAACSPTCSSATSRPIRVIAPDRRRRLRHQGAVLCRRRAVIPAAALRLGRPVKWIEDRREHFLCADPGARPVLEGRDRGRRRRQDPRLARHACCTTTAPSCRGASSCPTSPRRRCPAPMWCRLSSSTSRSCSPTRCATTPVRGAGRPQAVFAMERLMDRVGARARASTAPSCAARNMIAAATQMPYAVGLDVPRRQAARL